MSSITAQFLFAGFMRYVSNTEACNEVQGGYLREAASLMEQIADAADAHCATIGKQFPGIWEYDVVEPFGYKIAQMATDSKHLSVRDMIGLLNRDTDNWVLGYSEPQQFDPVKTDLQIAARGEIKAITYNGKNGRGVHFIQHGLLSGNNYNIWFPVAKDESWFVAVERVLMMNGIAENVTSCDPIGGSKDIPDLKIIFNNRIA